MLKTADNDFSPEQVLVSRLRQGDREAFLRLYQAYKVPLGYRLLQLLKNEVFAEELLQDLFLQIWEQREQIDPTRSFRAYLYRIAANMAYNFMRRAALNREILAEIRRSTSELYAHVEERLYQKENKALLTQLIDQLPPQRQKIFRACKMDGRSYKEVADEFGISPHTVNDHIQKALAFLRKKLDNPMLLAFFHLILF